eukprot:8475814-Pyramimonas_sp.AAC.1
MGSRFGLYIASHWSQDKQDEYSKAGNDKKKSMRQEWAEGKWHDYEKTRRLVKSRTELDSSIGTLLNLDALI